MSSDLMLVSYLPSCWRHLSAMASSSSEALPALSPIPLMVTWAQEAPACIPDSELATASPKSLWQWTETGRPEAATASEVMLAMYCGVE